MLQRDTNQPDTPTASVLKGEKATSKMDTVPCVSGKNSSNTDRSTIEDGDNKKASVDGVHSSSTAAIVGAKRKVRMIDETLLSDEEARKLELRRAYNRDCASRARTRTKSLVQELQEQVRALKDEKEELRVSNTNLQACLTFSEKQNRELIAKQSLIDGRQQRMTIGQGDFGPLNTSPYQSANFGTNNLTAASLLMYEAEQTRHLGLLQQRALLQHQQNAVAAAAVHAKLLPNLSTQPSNETNNLALSCNELNFQGQLNMNSDPNAELIAALTKMRQQPNRNS